MSQELTLKVLDAIGRRERDELFELLSPDFVWDLIGWFPNRPGSLHGPEEAWEYIAALDRAFEDVTIGHGAPEDAGETVIVPITVSGTGRKSGMAGELELVSVYEFDGGVVTRVRHYRTVEEAREAVI